MKEFESIITHPGGSHKDEFLACCVLLAIQPVAVQRREPTAADLADPSVCVVDVGHSHDPELNNYDHHQFDREHVPTCSLSLVLQVLGLYEDARQFCDWLEPAEWFDCRGPADTAKWLGVERHIITQMNSPIDVTLLRRFAKFETLEPGNVLWEMMKMIGEDLLDFIKSLKKRLEYVAEHSELIEINQEGEIYKILYLPRTEMMGGEPSAGLGRYIESLPDNGNVIGMIYPDRRGDGYGLSRYRDSAKLDFSRIDHEQDVHFAHKRGFVAKTSATDMDRLLELVNLAVT